MTAAAHGRPTGRVWTRSVKTQRCPAGARFPLATQPGKPLYTGKHVVERTVQNTKVNSLRPVQKQSAEAQTTDNLRAYILSGALQPGARLTEIPLAEQLGVARATLRTSLHRLAGEGIVVQTPYTGWSVTELTPEDVWELWTLRGSLEGLAAKLAAERMSPVLRATIEKARDALAAACATGDVRKANDADFALHRTIISSVDHRRLQKQYKLVEQQVRLYIATSNMLAADNLPQIVTQHEKLLDAILSADPVRASAEAWNHNEVEGGKLVAWLADRARTNPAG